MKENQTITSPTSSKHDAMTHENTIKETLTEIEDDVYREIADKLLYLIGSQNYFNGTIDYFYKKFNFSLSATLIIYRSSKNGPIAKLNPIEDIIPVWWEFHSFSSEGETLNDFSFSILKEFMLS